jgi:predicted neuraminidase
VIVPSVKPALLVAFLASAAGTARAQQPEFIAPKLPTASAHASTIVETSRGLVVAWFGGTREGAPDVGIWLSRHIDGKWTIPIEVANGVQPDGRRFPCYNPVLFQARDGLLRLFYKTGPAPARWWGMVRTSPDGGVTWSAAQRLPDGILGPIKNKPVQLASGVIVSPSSTESTDIDPVWRVHFELSRDEGRTWTRVFPARSSNAADIQAIQPSILIHDDGTLQALGRTRSDRVFETWSTDGGKTWSALALTALPNPNSGIDAVTLRDGRQLIVYNHATRARTPLNVAVSDDGETWQSSLVLENEPGEYSYPAVIQTRDGLVHVTYTWKRQNVRHVVLDPDTLRFAPPSPFATR